MEASKNYFLVLHPDAMVSVIRFPDTCTKSEFFHDVSKVEAFEDCTGDCVTLIVYQDKRYYYNGWEPNEHYTYTCRANPDLTYDAYYPEFNH